VPQNLYLRVRGQPGGFERRFNRLPLMIGRDATTAQCVLDHGQVSKLHASLDVRNGALCVRDLGSTNGTYVGGQRLAANQWVAVGAAERGIELQIADYTIHASAYEDQSAGPDAGGPASLAEWVGAPPVQPGRASVRPASPAPAALPDGGEPRAGERTYGMGEPASRLAPVCARFLDASNRLLQAIAQELEAAPATARTIICEEIARTYPALANEPAVQALMAKYGHRRGPAAAPARGLGTHPFAESALLALQDLASWYLGRERALVTPGDIAAFKDNLRGALDEFLLGYGPLLAGVVRFEQQMAIPSANPAPLPSAPAELARKLVDWRGDTGSFRQQLRSTFAELMMHHVAVLNGVMRGVKALLTELAPEVIEEAAKRERSQLGAWARLFSRIDPWRIYRKRHADLADEENERFRLLFGREFVDEYRQFTGKAGS
jgi:predicted component of type VI protein secretion system